MSSNDNNLFCVLHGPYVRDEPTVWSILYYKKTRTEAIKCATSICDLSPGDLICIVFIDYVTSLHEKSFWLGIAHTNGLGISQVIVAPYGSPYIYGKYWFDAYGDNGTSRELFYLIRNIDRRRIVKLMLECVMYVFKKDKRLNGEYAYIISEIVNWINGGDLSDEKTFKRYTTSSTYSGIVLHEELIRTLEVISAVMLIKDPEYAELFSRFMSDIGDMTDERDAEIREIIKAEVPMPVAILSNIGEYL